MPAIGRLQQTVQTFRSHLLARESQAQHALNTAHSHTLQAIQPKLNQLTQQIKEKQASLEEGETIPLSWLYEQNRLQAIKQLISTQINHYGALAQTTTGQLQRIGVQLGQQAGMASLKATVPAGINYSFGVPHPAAIATIVGATQAGSPLADLFNGFGTEAAQKASDALILGVTNGDNPGVIGQLLQAALDISRQRATTIARDQMLDAYRQANIETYRANSDVVDKMVRVADLSPRSCAACIALNGTEYDLGDDPGFHVNDRCTLVPKTKGWDDILGQYGIDTSDMEDSSIDVPDGSEWFDNQDEATQKAILGSQAAYDLYSSGVPLKAFVGVAHDADWGTSIYQKSAKQVKAEGKR